MERLINLEREFQIFAKPVGAVCNLRCSYCYYSGNGRQYENNHPVMNDDLLEEYIKQHIEASSGKNIFFSWHGGEPLLAGIEFYKKVLHFQKLHKPQDSEVVNGIQTNGTLLDSKWCSFLSSKKFLVGISMDGPEKYHDRFRKDKSNGHTFRKVLKGYELLLQHGIYAEILCVVNAFNVRYPLDIYRFFRKLGAKYITFLPLVERQVGSEETVGSSTVPADEFGRFLIDVFDEWVENDIGKIKVQIFEEAIRSAFRQGHTLCIFRENCGGVPVVEHDGNFYSCDHYVNPENFLGNIMDTSLSVLLDSERQTAFGRAKSLSLPEYCIRCEVKDMCNGECPRNRFIKTPDGAGNLNYLCSGYKAFFRHCRPFVEAVSAAWKIGES